MPRRRRPRGSAYARPPGQARRPGHERDAARALRRARRRRPLRRGRARSLRRRLQGHRRALRRVPGPRARRRSARPRSSASPPGWPCAGSARSSRSCSATSSRGFDQIVNGISKFRGMYDDQVTVPLVVRAPMGARRGYGRRTRSRSRSSSSGSRTSSSSRRASATTSAPFSPLRSRTSGRCSSSRTSSVRAHDPPARGRPRRRARGARDGGPYPALTFSATDFTRAPRPS